MLSVIKLCLLRWVSLCRVSWSHVSWRRHDIQHNDIQHKNTQPNDIQHNGIICDTQSSVEAEKAYQGLTLKLIRNICKLCQ